MNLSFLNEEQANAVRDTEGAVLVFAGAGSGKTRVLTHRIVYLIEEKNVKPWNILALTFTNKATNEMKIRLNDMLGENDVWVSTFHSLCTRILFMHADRIGYGKNFSIFDDSAAKRVLQRVLREKHINDEKELGKYVSHIASAKNKGLSPDSYALSLKGHKLKEGDIEFIAEVYSRYDEILKENNAMDFDDLLIRTKELLSSCEDVREYYQNKFRYVHVDEFQDTNEVQAELLSIFCGKHKNVFVVGDDDQSIYGWRGANIDNILNFDKVYSDVKVYKLQENYRSTQNILDCANNLIRNNVKRSEKSLFTSKKGGVKVDYFMSRNEFEEVDKIIDTVKALHRTENYAYSDCAILVRNNALTRIFEVNLNKNRISYKVYGGFKFFDRKEIQDVIAYFRVIANPKDGDALDRIINFPKRGIGDTTVEALKLYANKKNIPVYDAILEIEKSDLPTTVKNKILSFKDLMEGLKYDSLSLSLYEFAEKLVQTVPFEQYFTASGKEEDINRWENVKELLVHIKENFTEENTDMESFLHTIFLDKEEQNDFDADNLVLATMHAVKGLEFRVVFVVACEDGIIPSRLCFSEAGGIEEERRVMYVALTRAQDRLYISCVNGMRSKYGSYERAMPSRFIAETKGELPKIKLEKDYLEKRYVDDDYGCAIPRGNQMRNIENYNINKPIEQPKKIYNESTQGFVSGAKVEHRKYGIGTIIVMEGSGQSTAATVAFPNLGIKKFALANAPLKLI